MNTFTLYWKTGLKDILIGSSITQAFRSSVFSEDALDVVQLYTDDTNDKVFRWDSEALKWVGSYTPYNQIEVIAYEGRINNIVNKHLKMKS